MLPFCEIMQFWLYEKDRGYYVNPENTNIVGKKGDFYTSVSTSKFFGGSIARYILKLLDEGRLKLPLNIVEIGSNKGHLLADIAEFLNAFNKNIFYDFSFLTIEPNLFLADIQKNTFKNRLKTHYKNIALICHQRLSEFNSLNNTIFISNELMDSFPCDLVINEKMLFLSKDLSSYDFRDLASKQRDYISKFNIKSSEISLQLYDFLQDLSKIDNFIFLSFDYGDFLSRDMNLRIYKNHEAYNFYEELKNNNLSTFYQKADITYDIDFNLVGNIAKVLNLHIDFCKTQSDFLVSDCQILEIYEIFSQNFSNQEKIRHLSNIQNIIMPDKMGERFKAISLSSK